jgi:small subunit ribosomal protein S8
MSDSISDFITVIRNAYRSRKQECLGKHSKLHLQIARILSEEGYVREVEETKGPSGHKAIKITLKYVEEAPALTGIERASKSGRRLYFQHNNIPRVMDGLGVGIMTTSVGVMNDRDARRRKVGGEMICSVW